MAEIDRLTLEIEDKASSSSDGIESLTAKLKTLRAAVSPTVTSLNRLSNAFTGLVTSTRQLNNINFSKLNTSMQQLGNSFRTIERSTSALSNATTQLRNMANAMNSLNRATGSLSSAQSQTNSLNFSGLSSSMGQLSGMAQLGQSLQSLSQGAKSINSLTRSFEKLNAVDFKTTLNSVKQLSTVLDEMKKTVDDFASSSENIKLMSSALKSLNRAMEKLSKTTSGSNLDLSGLNLTVNKYASGMSGMGRTGMFTGATDFLSGTTIIREMANAFGYLLQQSNKYIETMNLYEVVMGSATQRGWEFISSLEQVGVDMEEAMRYQASFYDIASSMGVASNNAYTLSEQFTKLTYDYASLYNQRPDEMFYKLSAAITGELEPIRRLGKDISEAALSQTALSLGINESVRNMTQAEKAELRFITLMQQSSAAMNDMERTIMSPANALRILRAQFTSLARELGNLFIPILQAVLPWLIAIVQFIRQLVADIAGFFGIEMASIDFSGIDTQVNSIGTGTGNVADNLGDAASNAKKLKDYLLGIDELNVLNEDGSIGRDTGASGGVGVGGGGGGGLGVDLDDFGYDELLKDIESRADDILKLFEEWKTPLLIAAGILGSLWAVGKAYQFYQALKGIRSESVLLSGMQGLGALTTAFFGLAGSGGILGTAATAFVALGDSALMSFGIMTGSTTIAGLTGLGLVLGGIAALGIGIYNGLQPAIKSIDVLNGVSEESRTKLEPVIEAWQNLDTTMNNINWKGVITSADVSYIQGQASAMAEAVLNELDADRNQDLKDLEMLSGLESITAEQYAGLITDTNIYYDTITEETESALARINEITSKYGDENTQITEEDKAELERLWDTIGENAVTSMSESAQEQQQILDRLNYNKVALTVEGGSEVLKTAKANYDQQVLEYQDWKARMLKNLDEKFYNEKTISKEEYEAQKQLYETAYDEMVGKAGETYDEISKKVETSLGNDAAYIDLTTGRIKSNWEVKFEELKNNARTNWEKISNDVSWLAGRVTEGFGNIVSTVVSGWNSFWSFDWVGPLSQGIQGAMSSIGSKIGGWFNDNIISPLQKGWNNFWGGLGRYANQFSWSDPSTWISWSSQLPDDPLGGKPGGPPAPRNDPSVTFFARGGFVPRNASFIPPSGNLWTAGEAGREVIGNFRGRQTVMPLQDTEFVGAMYDAVYRAVRDSIDSAAQNNPPTPINVTVEMDSKTVAKALDDYDYSSGNSLIKRR